MIIRNTLSNEVKSKLERKAVMAAHNAKAKAEEVAASLADENGSVSEHAIVIIIGVVLGGILLVGLAALMNDTIMPATEDKVSSMFAMG